MKKLTTFLAILACSALVLPLAAQEKKMKEKTATAPATAEKVVKLGSIVPETLALTSLDGKSMTFKDLRGKVVLIHFWSKDCPFEKVADPKVVALEQRWKDEKDVVIVAINSNATEIGETAPADGYAALKEHAKKRGFTHAIYADHGNVVADLFQAKSTPHCFVLDKKGTVVYTGALDDDPKGDKGEATQQYARDAVEATLGGKEVPVKESKPYGCSIKRVKA